MTDERDPHPSPAGGCRRFWNAQGHRFTRSFYGAPSTQLYLEEEQALLTRHLGALRGKRLLKLDLWNEAQHTEILLWAAREGAICYGIDRAETTAQKAQARGCARGVRVGIAVADVVALPFAANAFDCVYTMGTLEHLPDAERAFAEIARVLSGPLASRAATPIAVPLMQTLAAIGEWSFSVLGSRPRSRAWMCRTGRRSRSPKIAPSTITAPASGSSVAWCSWRPCTRWSGQDACRWRAA